jgi:Protein of unknown function (DUF3616)
VWRASIRVTLVPMTVKGTIQLRFGQASRDAATHTNLSAVRSDGRVLWLAGDEAATVERLVADDASEPSEYAGQATFRLADLVDLPGPDESEEADIEGLARSGHFLWAVGSHSLRRKQIRKQTKDKHVDAKALDRLARVVPQANRQILARIPVAEVAGLPSLVAETVVGGKRLRAAVLGSRGDDLRELLRDDKHLAPFLPIPGKDNGFDIEGIAVREDRVYLGLRGPVLRGWAFVLELRPYADPDKPGRLRLRKFDDAGAAAASPGATYRKHALDLDGLGVRDLCPIGDDLLVLAGPSMDLDGPVRVYRWHGAYQTDQAAVVRGAALTREVDVPHGDGDDHAEGIGLIGPPERPRLIVVYDSPTSARCPSPDTVLADLIELP